MTKEEIRELVSCTPLSQTEDFIANQQAEIAALKAEVERMNTHIDVQAQLKTADTSILNDEILAELTRLRAVESAAKSWATRDDVKPPRNYETAWTMTVAQAILDGKCPEVRP